MVKEFRNTPDTQSVINWLEIWFLDLGYAQRLCCDGGPQMHTQLEDYCRRAKIVMEKASAYHPESNGAAESSTKQVKNLYKK